MLWVPKYYQIDGSSTVAYPEQLVGLQYLKDKTLPGDHSLYGVSMAIMDPAPLFDVKKNFRDNLADISHAGKHRACTASYRNQSIFDAYYAAGTRVRYDEYRNKNVGACPPHICFNFIVDMAPDDRLLEERISQPLMVMRGNITPGGIYTFENFTDKTAEFHTEIEERTRIYTAQGFVEELFALAETKSDVFGKCMDHAFNGEQASVGEIYAGAVSCMTKMALGVHSLRRLPLLTYKTTRDEKGEILDRQLTTVDMYVAEKKMIPTPRLTAPLKDPAAAYNLLQVGKILDGRYAEGAKQAVKAAGTINEQNKAYTLC